MAFHWLKIFVRCYATVRMDFTNTFGEVTILPNNTFRFLRNTQNGKNMIEKDTLSIQEWCQRYPLLKQLIAYEEVLWLNPATEESDLALRKTGLDSNATQNASDRLERFRPYISSVFPETRKHNGLIESPLLPIPAMQKALTQNASIVTKHKLLLKCDNLLPISGSVKARGGIYEVLKHAEQIAITNDLLTTDDDYTVLAEQRIKKVLSNHSIAVGSTGNLGLSIGIMGTQLGFQVTVHMSADGRQWKKDLLRKHGVKVVEYDGDYSLAVTAGRKQAKGNSRCYFIDDENSIDLFLGYAVAAKRVEKQLNDLSITVDSSHPLYVYLPCGVGGGPGGITFGLKQVFGNNVHCFFAEPTHSPCMLIGLYTGLHDKVSVRDFGLDNKTDADGLAVSRPSGFIGKTMAPLIDGVFTVDDKEMYRMLALLADTEGIWMEPSALAGMAGMSRILSSSAVPDYSQIDAATHIVWGTGGNMVPEEEMDRYYKKNCTASNWLP